MKKEVKGRKMKKGKRRERKKNELVRSEIEENGSFILPIICIILYLLLLLLF